MSILRYLLYFFRSFSLANFGEQRRTLVTGYLVLISKIQFAISVVLTLLFPPLGLALLGASGVTRAIGAVVGRVPAYRYCHGSNPRRLTIQPYVRRNIRPRAWRRTPRRAAASNASSGGSDDGGGDSSGDCNSNNIFNSFHLLTSPLTIYKKHSTFKSLRPLIIPSGCCCLSSIVTVLEDERHA